MEHHPCLDIYEIKASTLAAFSFLVSGFFVFFFNEEIFKFYSGKYVF